MRRLVRHRSEGAGQIDGDHRRVVDWSGQPHAMAAGVDADDARFFPTASSESYTLGVDRRDCTGESAVIYVLGYANGRARKEFGADLAGGSYRSGAVSD